jgi:hypothetical protein
MTTILIPLRPGSEYDRTSYGITHRSEHVYRVTGKGVHNRSFPHRVQVWDNTVRPNTDPDQLTEFTGRVGPGAYIDPQGKGTDAATTVTTSAESIAITRTGANTGTAVSGQVYAPHTMTIGDYILLVYPDGTLSDPYVLTARPLGDPGLVPVAQAAVAPELRRAVRAAKQFDREAAEEMHRLGEQAEKTCDYRHRDERSADLGELAWEHLGALLAHLDHVH